MSDQIRNLWPAVTGTVTEDHKFAHCRRHPRNLWRNVTLPMTPSHRLRVS
jgi:hypothetical protein